MLTHGFRATSNKPCTHKRPVLKDELFERIPADSRASFESEKDGE